MSGKRIFTILLALVLAPLLMGGVMAVGPAGAPETGAEAPISTLSLTLMESDLSGSGTVDDPYLIYTEAGLQAVSNSLAAHYRLEADIALTAENWVPIGLSTAFSGTFDGNGHKISGLNISGTTYTYVGLFGQTTGTIKNLTVEGSVSGSKYVGLLAAYSKGPITNCFTSGSAENTSSGDTGGLVGYHNAGVITACGSTAAVTGVTGDAGGLVGDNHAEVRNCYAQGNVTCSGSATVGGLMGYNSAYVRSCYASGNVSSTSSYKGGLIGNNDGGGVYNCYSRSLSGGKLNGFSVTVTELKDRATFAYWDFDHLWTMDGGYPYINYRGEERTITFQGSGYEDDPYLIETEDQLYHLAMNFSATPNTAGAWYQLTNDIAITAPYWTPIGAYAEFKANIDGAGHKVTGLSTAGANYNYVGLFGLTSGAIKNLRVDGSVSGSNYVGLLAGYSKGAITNCFTSGSAANTSNGNTGGLVGYHDAGAITACGSTAAVTGVTGDAGGLVGDNRAQVTDCYAQGNVSCSGSANAGGLIGYNAAAVTNTYAIGAVSTTSSNKGGLIGNRNSGIITASFYNRDTSHTTDTGKGAPADTAEMKTQATYTGWDFSEVWAIDPALNQGYPYLRAIPPEIEETPVSVTGVSLDQTSLTLTVGETGSLTATVLPEDAANKDVSWQSSNAAVASVDNGVVTALSAGTATVTVTTADGGLTASCTVTVRAAAVSVTGVSLDKTSLTLTVGGTETLKATVLPEDATNKGVSWQSSNAAVAAVDNGVITALSAGTATITVTTADGGLTASCTVTVRAAHVAVTGLTIQRRDSGAMCPAPAVSTRSLGNVDEFRAVVEPANATNQTLIWESSDPSVAEGSGDGVIQIKKRGRTTLTVRTEEGGFERTIEIFCYDGLQRLDVIKGPTNKRILRGSPLDVSGLVVNAVYTDHSELVMDYALSGYNADQLGTQTITVSYLDVSAQFQIEVIERAMTGITIASKPGKLAYAYGEDFDRTGLMVTAQYNDGTTQTVTGYSVTGYNKNLPGTQMLTVSYQGFTAAFSVTVGEKPVAGNVVKPVFSIESFIGGKRITLTAEGASIYYTLDGSTPTAASTRYTGPIELTDTATVKAIAVSGGVSSSVTSARITVSRVEAPVAAPAGGTVDKGTVVTLRSDTVGASVYYTTDGSEPSPFSENSVKYKGAVFVQDNMTLKAIAVKDGYVSSEVVTETYTIPEAPADAVLIALGSVTVPAGSTASVPVYLFTDSASQISGFRFTISFDPYQFDSGVTITPAEGIDASELFSAVNGGTVTLMYTGQNGIESGEICTINLVTLASLAPDTDCPLEVLQEKSSVSVAGFEKVELSVANAGITVTETQLSSDVVLTEQGNGQTEASITIYNDTPDVTTPIYANLYLAVYDRSGRMVSVDSWRVDVTDPMFLFTQTITIPQGVEVGSIKVMLMSDAMVPLSCAGEMVPVSVSGSVEFHHVAKKPVIYLYPETELEAEVVLDYDGELTCTYPAYADRWTVTAAPDGTLTDRSGQTYNYLYWEGEGRAAYDLSRGFCVAGSDTAAFLEDALAKLGLTRREANEFIVYWLPLMQSNPWNLISFQGAAYTDTARLRITPEPDTVIRVFMAWKPLEAPVDIRPQTLTAPARTGFTVVEWGGAELTD